MHVPATLDLTIYQGATWDRSLTWQSPAGTPVNLTGYTAAMQVRARRDVAPVLSLASGTGITLGGALGTIALAATATTTAAIPAGTYLYDLELTSGATVTRLVQGRVTVSPEITVPVA